MVLRHRALRNILRLLLPGRNSYNRSANGTDPLAASPRPFGGRGCRVNPQDFTAILIVAFAAIALASILLLAGEWGDA